MNLPQLEHWLHQAQNGDARARNHLLASLRGYLRARLRLPSRLDESDAVQEACLRVHLAFERIEPDCPLPRFLAWVRVILEHVIADHARRVGRRDECSLEELAVVDEGTGPVERAERQERDARLAAALEQLPFEQQQAFQLRWHQGLTFEQIGNRLGVPLGRARVLFLRAVEHLRQCLGEVVA